MTILETLEMFIITDGTTDNTFDVLENFCLQSWERTIQTMKNAGVWQDSPLADNRRLVDYRWSTAIEEFIINAPARDADNLGDLLREMRRVLLRARSFWLAPTKIRPIYVIYKKIDEQIPRYALVHNFETPADTDILQQRAHIGIVADEYQIMIERSAWRKQPPGLAECLEFFYEATDRDPRFDGLFFAQSTACGDRVYTASLDLYQKQFAWDGWLKIDWEDQQSPNIKGQPICCCYDASIDQFAGWRFQVEELYFGNVTFSLWAFQSGPGLGDDGYKVHSWQIPRDEVKYRWFHLSLRADTGWNSGDTELRIDGVLKSVQFQDDGFDPVGSVTTFHLGNDGEHDKAVGLKMGWQRLWNVNHNFSGFAYEDLCEVPGTGFSGTVEAAWQHQPGEGTNLTDLGTNSYDLTLTDVGFFAICNNPSGLPSEVRTCEPIVLRNGNLPDLTHMFRYDASGTSFSLNLIGDIDAHLFDDPSGIGDMLYVGHTDVPFDILLFNLAVAAVTAGVIIPEVYTGVWTNVTSTWTDNTNFFTELGPNLIYLNQANTMVKTTINGITAYWMRFRLTVASMTTVPVQDNDLVRAQNKNWFVIDDLGGDIGVETQLQLLNKLDYTSTYMASKAYRVILGVKNIGTSPDFQATANFSDIFVGGQDLSCVLLNGSYTNSVDAPTGRVVQHTMTAGNSANLASIQIPSSVASQYNGRYNVFVRAKTSSGPASFDISGYYATQNKTVNFDKTAVTGTLGAVLIYNLGTMQLPVYDAGILPRTELEPSFWITIDCVCNINGTIELVDLIMMPADEMYIDAYLTQRDQGGGASFGQIIELGSVKTLTRNLLARILNVGGFSVTEQMDYFCQRRFQLPSRDRHAVSFLFVGNWPAHSGGNTGEDFSNHALIFETTMDGNELYLSVIPPSA